MAGQVTNDPTSRRDLEAEYGAALAAYLSGGGEEALTQAYEIGRRAAVGGISVLEIATIHHDALARLMEEGQDASAVAMAGGFLAESLSPFEMSLRAYEANVRLLGLSETLSERNAEIDRARRQLQTILDATTALIYLKDAEGRYLFVNQRFETVFGRAKAEVIGHTDFEVFLPSLATVLHGNDNATIAAATPREMEESLPGGDEARTYVSLKFPLMEADGSVYGLCCVATDITERKRAAEALRLAKAVADEANRELEAFSYSVAHDLRAPLRRIDGFSEALVTGHASSLDERGRGYLRFIRESAKTMGQLIDDLLSLSKVVRTEMYRSRVDLSAIAREILGRLRAAEPTRDVTVVVEDGLTVSGDAGLLRIALENLLGNAWKFTGKRARARIEVGRQAEGAQRAIFVRDDGAGFDMAHAGKLFGVFQRLHSTAEFDGTGIGLATVRRIVGRHGGRIWAEGAPDRGATFYFTID